MAGYAAVISLKQTIERILDSSRFSLVPPSPEIIRLACRQLKPLKTTLERLDSSSISKSRKKLNALDADIKDAVWKLEDVLETLLSDQILSQFQTSAADLLLFTIDLQSLQPDVDSFIKAVKDLEVIYIYELQNMAELEEAELGRSCTNDSGGIMVGFSSSFEKVKNDLTEKWDGNSVHSFLGMGGRGKTTLVKKLFEDSEVVRCFEYRVWVSVGRKSEFNEIADAILAELDPNTYNVGAEDEVNIGMYLKKRLEGKRCLIVLDDVWDTQLLDCLTASLPDKNSAMIQILLTTRLPTVAEHTFKPEFYRFLIRMPGLNEEESKELLRKKVFGEEDFPPQIRKAAEKIARNCEGLPLMIVTVADLISKANNNDPLYWDEVAERRSSVFMDAYNQISEVLFPTYDVLPQRVKMILIFAGSCNQYFAVPYLIYLLSAEGFCELQNLKKNVDQTLHEFGWKCGILDLQKENGYRFYEEIRVYSWWLHLFNREASKDKFLHVLTSGTDFLGEGLKGQRRLCLHSNFIFNFKVVHNSVKCDCASTTRSLLCFGPYHQYSMPLTVGFKLLWVLDALAVRFYNFPFEILELVLLQFLALTCSRELLPTSISKLFNLEFLIIYPHMHIKSCVASSYMPIEIWDMQELKHIEIKGSNLPNPNSASSLQKLSTLFRVSPDNCTKEVFEKIPNLKELSIEIELKPYVDDSNPLCCLDHISTLKNLEVLVCFVTNPEVKYEFVAPPTPPSLSMFPSSLQKLSLTGLGYSWKQMKAIGSLPNLKLLNLRCNAFRGPKWGTKRKSFLSLKSLLIKDCDLEQWKPRCGSFPKLETVKISHCYKLKEVYWPSAAAFYGRIKLDSCNPLAAACAEQFKLRNKKHQLQIISTFDKD